MFGKLLEKPLKFVSLTGMVYLVITIVLNIFTGFSYKDTIYPFAAQVIYAAEGVSLVLFLLSFLSKKVYFVFYVGLELLIFADIYCNNIYTALFLSAILLVFLLTQHTIVSRKHIIIYSALELAKLALVVPYGATAFFYYAGLALFVICTIVCINLLFKNAYEKKSVPSLNLEDFNLTDRQKNCIKEIVVNNTTIKALSIDYKVSESAIKKDLAHIYKVFGITGKADLKALFIDYKF